MRELLRKPASKGGLVLLSLLPFLGMCWGIYNEQLGPNPAENLIRSTGDWTLRFLCLTLFITPLRVHSNWPEWLRFRRSLGLLAFFYASLHALSYSLFDMGWEWDDIVQDILKRPFIAVGFAAAVLMTLLAATSFNAAVKAMGGQRWRQLHRAVYVIAILGVLHFFWMRASKKNFNEVFVYASILGSLLGWRLIYFTKRSR